MCFTGDRQPVLGTQQLRVPESRPRAPLVMGYCVLLHGSVGLATADHFTDGPQWTGSYAGEKPDGDDSRTGRWWRGSPAVCLLSRHE